MKATISIKCKITKEQAEALQMLQKAYMDACNTIVPFVVANRCWNRFSLHKLTYNLIRENSPLGSQMVCNAIFSVCKAYKSKSILKEEAVPTIQFRKGGKRIRTRLHRWSYFQLQTQIEYKALQKGLQVIYINPAYTSQTCSHCDQRGERLGNTFKCSCGNQQHSDLNASRNLCRFARSKDLATCAVNRTQVAAL